MTAITTEAQRLATLAEYGILDTASEPQFDAIVATAAATIGTPISTISIIDTDRQWFKARVGIDEAETPIGQSFCAQAIRSDDVLVVNDASTDERFRDYPNVTGAPHIRFYAGVPLKMKNGARLGTLCVIDVEPRDTLDADEREALQQLARQAVAAFELRRDMRGGAGAIDFNQTEARRWLDEAGDLLAKAAAALDRIGATVPLAHIDHVITMVDELRAAQPAPSVAAAA